MLNNEIKHDLLTTAYYWHGGDGSPLHTFCRLGGVIISEDHRNGLRDEIGAAIDNIEHNDDPPSAERRLYDLLRYIQSAPWNVALTPTGYNSMHLLEEE